MQEENRCTATLLSKAIGSFCVEYTHSNQCICGLMIFKAPYFLVGDSWTEEWSSWQWTTHDIDGAEITKRR